MVSVFREHSRCNVSTDFYHNLFADHLLQAKNLIPRPRTDFQQVWPSVLLLLCLTLLVLLKLNSFSKVLKIIQSSFSLQALHQLEREEMNPFRFSTIGLNTFFVFNVSFLLYKINSLNKFILVNSDGLSQYLFFFLVVLVVFGFKTIVNAALGYFTGERKIISEYVTNSLFINQTFGLFLFPWVILMELSPFNPVIFVSAAVIIMASSILLKWYRGVIMGLVEERIGFLQIFSYFCSLEILPVFVLVKYIIETF